MSNCLSLKWGFNIYSKHFLIRKFSWRLHFLLVCTVQLSNRISKSGSWTGLQQRKLQGLLKAYTSECHIASRKARLQSKCSKYALEESCIYIYTYNIIIKYRGLWALMQFLPSHELHKSSLFAQSHHVEWFLYNDVQTNHESCCIKTHPAMSNHI